MAHPGRPQPKCCLGRRTLLPRHRMASRCVPDLGERAPPSSQVGEGTCWPQRTSAVRHTKVIKLSVPCHRVGLTNPALHTQGLEEPCRWTDVLVGGSGRPFLGRCPPHGSWAGFPVATGLNLTLSVTRLARKCPDTARRAHLPSQELWPRLEESGYSYPGQGDTVTAALGGL